MTMSETPRTDALADWPIDQIPTPAEKAKRYFRHAQAMEREAITLSVRVAALEAGLRDTMEALKQTAYLQLEDDPKDNAYTCPHCGAKAKGLAKNAMEEMQHSKTCAPALALQSATQLLTPTEA